MDEQPPLKRQREAEGAIVKYGTPKQIRVSKLAQTTMKLTGHKGSVYCLAFDERGESLVSGSFDMKCLLWNTTGMCDNYNILDGHKNAILDVAWSADSEFIATASADKTVGWFDAKTGFRVKRHQGHSGIVNALDTAKASKLVVSASDDCTAKLWDARVRNATGSFSHDFQVTSVAFSDDSNCVFTGSIDNKILAWDTRKSQELLYSLTGHADTITYLSLHPKGTHLLSNSMDGTLRSWDVRPFVAGARHSKTFHGCTHSAEKGLLKCSWSADGKMLSAGSSDRMVHIWDELTAEELYLLPGHTGCVNSVVFHPTENVVASGSSDKCIFVGELG